MVRAGLGVIGPRASDKTWAYVNIPMPIFKHFYTRKVIVATAKRKEDNKIMTRILTPAAQY